MGRMTLLMKKMGSVLLIAWTAAALGGCGRDDNQEKIGATAADPGKAPPMPDGTKTGGRTTAPPK